MRFARAGWAAAALVLLAAGGCDYWDNLVDVNTLTKADLDVKVVDAWTGEPLAGTACRDPLQSISDTTDGEGGIRIVAGATGQYAITCSHEWYYDGTAKVHVTKAGAHAVVKLARRGLGDWYPFGNRQVRFPFQDSVLRFPADLDWEATPADTTGRFRYEWSFLHAPSLDFGQLQPGRQLDPNAYSPHFRRRASSEQGVQAGPDTAILKVYSLLDGSQNGYLVGTDTVRFRWVRNRKPWVHFSFFGNTYQVGCPFKVQNRLRFAVTQGDSDADGRCVSIRVITKDAPSLMDSILTLSCESDTNRRTLELIAPSINGRHRSNGSEEYDNKIVAEIMDDNGETGRDSISFTTYTNARPNVFAKVIYPKENTLWLGDPIPFEIRSLDHDGGVSLMKLFWIHSLDGHTDSADWISPNSASDSGDTVRFTQTFTLPGKYRLQAMAMDDCGDTGVYVSPLDFMITQDTPPSVRINDITTVPNGDSVTVRLTVMVTDPDALTLGKDDISLVSVKWDGSVTETDSVNVQAIPGGVYSRSFPASRSGSTLPIEFKAMDMHSGIGFADTTYRIP